ncbi:MAG: flavin reductase family protein [Eubacterium ventriosum]
MCNQSDNRRIGICHRLIGVKSGKDEDKFKNASLTKEPAKYVKAPLIKESPVNIECQVTDVVPCGSHDMFVAKVLCVHADKKYMDENGTFSFEKAKPIVYSHGWYYGLGKKIGKFGYSVIKKKQEKEIQKKQINIQKCLKISLTDKEKLICQARMKNNLIKITV